MALIQVNYMSRALSRMVPLMVVLPVDKFGADFDEERSDGGEGRAFKTLYLLHGVFGNCTDWVSGTRIQRWAEERDLCVVMPSGDNSFYVDDEAKGDFYSEFIGKELVSLTRRMFPLSKRREDTFVGGLSMGGFGALLNGLRFADSFSRIIVLSGALHLLDGGNAFAASCKGGGVGPDVRPSAQEGAGVPFNSIPPLPCESAAFGDFAVASRTDKNPRVLAERLSSSLSAERLPALFMACGTQDPLLSANRSYRDLLVSLGFSVSYFESEGGHDWDFWDAEIKRAIDWLPLGSAVQGVNSGNVGI